LAEKFNRENKRRLNAAAGLRSKCGMKTLATFIFSTITTFAFAQESFTDPAAAGVDYTIQGEYAGEGSGAQVIALGDGKFRVVGWDNGLPGAVDNAERKDEIEGELKDGKVIFKNEKWDAVLENGVITGKTQDKTYTLKKTERKSPTLGAKPPEGALVLFDGTNADEWVNGKVDAAGFLSMGMLSKKEFGDCTLHVEFRTPFMPKARGQARGNSGIYIQNRYEVQVLDSFGLKGMSNEAGGIYSMHKPKVNMCFPPLTWQTYDIDFTAAKWDADGKKTANARITVKHNGIVVQDNVEITKETASSGKKDGPGPGPIQLQNHGNPVAYRNIWIVEKK
jgi:hypothetical protein